MWGGCSLSKLLLGDRPGHPRHVFTHRDMQPFTLLFRTRMDNMKSPHEKAILLPVSDPINPYWAFTFFAALSEMESTLLSVVKDRKSQRNISVFVDSLIQSTLTDRQVKAPRNALGNFSYYKTRENGLNVSFCCGFRSWRIAWFSHWPDVPSQPIVS